MAAVTWNKTAKRWEARLQRDGIRRRFYSDRPGIRGKQEVLQQIRDFENGLLPVTDRKVSEVWPEYLEDVLHRVSATNYQNRESDGRLYILPTMGERFISEITLNDWQVLLNSVTGRDGRVLAVKTISNIRSTISAFVRFCYRCGLVPSPELDLYIPKGHPTVGKVIMQPDQIRALFSDDFGDHYINAWRLMLLTGLRPGEALGLQWTDLQNGCLNVCRSINRAGELTDGKNENAHRTVPLSRTALEVLADQKARTAHFASPWIFCNIVGARTTQSSAAKALRRTVTAIGCPAVTMYSLRHTFVSILSATVPEAMLKKIVGHSQSMDTLGVYGHRVDGDENRIATALESALAPLTSLDAPISSSSVSSEELHSKRERASVTRLGAS